MTKSELIEKVSGKVKNFTKRDVEIIVDTIFENMTGSLAKGEKIEIRGFGSFKVKEHKARKGRNPKTGESIDIPSKKTPFFKVGKELKERVNQ
ncbi:MAG: integration host factor subunit beta [Deltaproteobacteria bacterium GWC2_42_51]|nr:MAG: integration host factor subunit beta [Deltaproteobacteria bacterium GWA2_42_85]OGP23938.1 MAG: integration host factor subunit beta [Deltaproteobacteria bacterium GWB2_42_7]OGP33804.1 MAG: integration host factor subunit beta [Deltaproteobacteria bacterium GWC2_42_51]OGP40861.1 MAG: integration host factor subunit beta [Deltaproteobacteria bacterium GWD2_42_10]OGP48644.1 MAG: integration host factor subunit beta [Deltaproteobacteria bacterium GWF2_42_12]OGQ36903.1 MAG: integration host